MDQQILDPATIDVRRLGNGLTAVVRTDRSAPVVAIVTHLRVGYFDEADDQAGISHVLEHMFFKGTPARGPGVIAQQTKAAGGLLNAATIYDYTSYYTVLPASSLEQGLAIQSDALLNSVIDADELSRELQVIIQEARRKLDNPSAVAAESLYALMFDRHRMRRWRIGTEEFLGSLTRDQLFEYYRTMYRGEVVTLVVAGDVDAGRAHALIEQHYGALAAHARPIERGPAEPARRQFRIGERAGDIVHTHLEIGWRTPGTQHEDTPALDTLAVILGQGRASRLYRLVRETGLVHSITARNYTPTELGVFQISAELDQPKGLAALDAMAAAIEGLKQRIDETEVERAISIIEARAIRRLESMEGQANFLAEWQSLGDWRLGEAYLASVRALTAERVRAAAHRYLDLGDTSIFAYRPEGTDALQSAEPDLERRLQTAAPLAVAGVTTTTRRAAPVRAGALKTEDGVHEYVTDDGVRIYIKPRRSTPLVSLAIAATGGANRETAEQAGWTALAARCTIKGTRHRSALEIALSAEARGASISPSVAADAFDWYTSVPSRHFEAALDLLADVALAPSFPNDDVEREKQIALADLQQVRDDMYRYPLRLFLETAWSGHAYGFSLDQSMRAVSGASADALRGWHEHTTSAGGLAVFVVGDVDPDGAAAAAAALLQSRPQPTIELRAPAWASAGRERSEPRAKAQTALVLGWPGVDRNHPDLYALQVLGNTIAGLGGRLFEELRSRRSLAYTVTAYPIARQLGGAFITYIATAPEREDEAIRGLLDEIDRVRQQPLEAQEVERAKRYMIGSFHIRAQTNGAQLGDLLNAVLIGRGLAELREYEERVRAVTTADILAAAQRYFDDAKLVRAVVRGGASIQEPGN